VADYLELSSDSHQWNVSFIRDAHDWEVDVFASFFNLLYSFRLRQGGEDKLRWDPPREGCLTLDLSITSLYLMIALPSLGRVFGRNKVP
jgi:hypothetical protein